MKTLTEALDFWIFRSYAPVCKGLPLFRIFFACFLIVFYLPINTGVSTLPHSFFAPPLSLAAFFPGFPPFWFFRGIDYFLELGAFCLLFGCQTRYASLLMAALIIINNSFAYSTGKINGDILVPATLFCLAWSDWGRRYSADTRRLPFVPRSDFPAWPVALLMLTIGLCMVTACISKAQSGWLNPHLECCRGQLLLNYIGLDRPKKLADVMLTITSPLFWKFLDVSTVLLEGSFIVAMFWLPAMRFATASACVFHAFIYFSMDIFFIYNPAAYACLVDFRFLLKAYRVRRWFRQFIRLAERIHLWHLVVFVAALDAVYLAAGSPDWKNGVMLNSVVAFILLILGAWALFFLSWQRINRHLGNLAPMRRSLSS